MQHSTLPEQIPLTGVDKSFFVVEEDDHPMTVASCWLFHERLDLEEVLLQVERMVEQFPRFRMRLSAPNSPWWPNRYRYWESYDFCLTDHVTETDLPDSRHFHNTTQEELLQKMMGDLFSEPWDMDRALWHTHLIHYGDNCSAMFTRVHHSVTDGQGAIRCLLSITQQARDRATQEYGRKPPPQCLPTPPPRAVEKALALLPSAIRPWITLVIKLIILVWGMIQSSARFLYILFIFKRHNMQGQLTTRKCICYSDDIDLTHVTAIKNAFGVTVNDVMLSAIAGSFYDYIKQNERQVKDRNLLSYVPVSMRRHDDWGLGNKVAAIWAYLPLNIEDPVQRLYEVNKRLNVLKRSSEPAGTYFFTHILGNLPLVTCAPHRWFIRCAMSNPHAVITNVPGPRTKLKFAGKMIESYLIFAPQPGDGTLGVALISYNDRISCSLLTDMGHLADNGASIAAGVARHVEDLYELIPPGLEE